MYNCRLTESKSYQTILSALAQADEKATLFIYDNSPKSQLIIHEDLYWLEVKYIHDSNNSGLSKAYNEGAKFANTKCIPWIILLDQDTEFDKEYLNKVNTALVKYPEIVLFVPMLKLKSGNSFSPVKYKYKRAFPVELLEGIHSLTSFAPVNSGMVINIEAFKRVGGYNEQIKLDFADFQFIERLNKRYDEFYLLDSIAVQDFSNDEPDLNKNISRFIMYLDCAKNCTRASFMDNVYYFYVVARHTTALTLKFKSATFAKLLYTNYLKNTK